MFVHQQLDGDQPDVEDEEPDFYAEAPLPGWYFDIILRYSITNFNIYLILLFTTSIELNIFLKQCSSIRNFCIQCKKVVWTKTE